MYPQYHSVIERVAHELFLHEKEKCKDSKEYFISNYIYIRNPKNAAKGLPTKFLFNLYPEQIKLINAWEALKLSPEGGSRLLEKSREEGATFLMLAYAVHEFIFNSGSVTTLGSRKVDLVDKSNDPDTLFEKLRAMLQDLPDWLKPKYDDNYLRLRNLSTDSVIKGEGGDNMGRGGRSTTFLVDEWDFVDRPAKVFNSINENAHAKIFISTVAGTGTFMHTQGQTGTPVDRLMWRDNPTKNHSEIVNGKVVYPWYEQKKLEYAADPIGLATEIDADRSSATRGVLIPYAWVQSALDFVMDAEGISRSGLDVSEDNGGDIMPYANFKGGVVRQLERMSGSHLEKDIRDRLERDHAERLAYDRNGVGAYALKNLNAPSRCTVSGVRNNQGPTKATLWDRPTTENDKGEAVPFTCDMRFGNLAAQLGWQLRLMFLATHETVTGVRQHPLDNCISLHRLKDHPDRNEIITQLSQPTFERKGNKDLTFVDKLGLGSKSPDFYEALMYALYTPETIPTLETYNFL